jgi:hypothetical protein
LSAKWHPQPLPPLFPPIKKIKPLILNTIKPIYPSTLDHPNIGEKCFFYKKTHLPHLNKHLHIIKKHGIKILEYTRRPLEPRIHTDGKKY